MEVEWQFELPSSARLARWLRGGEIAALGLRLGAVRDQSLVDRYFDFEDGALRRAGFALRLRIGETSAPVATLKALSAGRQGKSRRTEIDEPWPRARDLFAATLSAARAADLGRALVELRGAVGKRLRRHRKSGELQLLFILRTRRRVHTLESLSAGTVAAEVCFDRVAISGGPNAPTGSRTELRRLEVEAKGDGERLAAGLVARLRRVHALVPARESKLAAAVRFCAPPSALTREALARRALSTQLDALALALRSWEGRGSPESIHRLRVALRRQRGVLRAFSEVLPPRLRAVDAKLQQVARVAGSVRDLDVLLAALPRVARSPGPRDRAVAAFRAFVLRRRALASARLGRLLARDLLPSTQRDLRSWTERPGGDLLAPPARAWVAERVRRLRKRLRRDAERLDETRPPAEFHEVRIRAKRLRDLIEACAPLFRGEERSFRRKLVELQDILGRLQDAVAGRALVRAFRRAGRAAQAALVDTILARRVQRQRERALGAREELDSAAWHRLAAALEATDTHRERHRK